MGILDKKTRFIDLVVTSEGKRQMAAGKLRAEFVSLSDCHAFYDKSELDDVANRLYFETMHRRENQIVLEKDDSGKLLSFDFSPTGSLVGNDIFVKDTTITTSLKLKASRGPDFVIGQNSVLAASIQHFKNNYFIGTEDPQDLNEFEISNKEITYVVKNNQPFPGTPLNNIINVNDAEPFFLDSKLAHIENFSFLPPVNDDGSQFGQYQDIRSTSRDSWEDIKSMLGDEYTKSDKLDSVKKGEDILRDPGESYLSQKLLRDGKLPIQNLLSFKPVETLIIKKTSTQNNLLVQAYEDSLGAAMTKLDVIDAGVFIDQNDPNERFEKRVFYIGKVYQDDLKIPTFINIFTMILD